MTPSPHHPIGAKGVGESPNVGGVPCFSNAVNDAFCFLGSTHIQMPHDFWRNWKAAKELGAWSIAPDDLRTASQSHGHSSLAMQHRRVGSAEAGYIADAELATAIVIMHLLKRPLLLEGEAGVGKTEVAKALASVHDDRTHPAAML